MKRNPTRTITVLVSILFTGSAAVHAEWVEGGIPVCAEDYHQSSPRVAPDGSGGAIIVWADGCIGGIYAQRIGPYGRLLWDPGGVPVCSEEGRPGVPRVISDGEGGAIIAWADGRHIPAPGIYVQRIGGSGSTLWEGEVAVSVPIGASQSGPRIAADGAGGAIVVWEDLRDGYRKIYAQRIDSNGGRLWDSEGIRLSDSVLHEGFLQGLPDGAGGTIVVWVATPQDAWTLYAQRISADGSPLWNEDVVVASGSFMIAGFALASDDSCGVCVAWDNADYYPLHRLFAQRIDTSGAARWSPGGMSVFASSPGPLRPRPIPDGTGGAIFVWELVSGSTYRQYAQRVYSNGIAAWGENGVEICYTASSLYGLRLIPDGAGGAISVWSEERHPEHYDIVAQRIDGNGDFQWTITGLSVCAEEGDQREPALIPDGVGGMIVAWTDGRNRSDSDIYALRVGPDGRPPPVTKLQGYEAYIVGFDVVIEWTLEQAGSDMVFSVFRAVAPDTVFTAVSEPEIGGGGLSYQFVDREREPSTTFRYRVVVSDDEGVRTLFTTDFITTPALPVTLYQNFPNPFNPLTTIRFYLPNPAHVRLCVYNANGELVATILDRSMTAGRAEIDWHAIDDAGRAVSGGVYFYRLAAGASEQAKKMVLLK